MECLTKRLPMRWVLQPDQHDEYLCLSVISRGMMDWLRISMTHGGDATYPAHLLPSDDQNVCSVYAGSMPILAKVGSSISTAGSDALGREGLFFGGCGSMPSLLWYRRRRPFAMKFLSLRSRL